MQTMLVGHLISCICCLLTFLALAVPSAEAQGIAAQPTAVLPFQPAALPHLPARPRHSLQGVYWCNLTKMISQSDKPTCSSSSEKEMKSPCAICSKPAMCVAGHERWVGGLPHAGVAAQSAAVLAAWPGWPPELA